MKRKAEQTGPVVGGGQQQSVAAEIVKPHPRAANRIEQPREAIAGDQLAGQQMMTLHPGIVARNIGAVDRAER